MTIDAGDQPAAITWHGESWVGPEFGGGAVRRQLVRALEADYGFRIAVREHLVGPDARVGLGIVDQTGIAVCLMRITVDALDVRGAATVAVRVHAELVLASRAANRRPIDFTIAAFDGPVIIAVVVNSAMPVE